MSWKSMSGVSSFSVDSNSTLPTAKGHCPCFDPFFVVRGDSPLLGFHNDLDNNRSGDPLHFPSADYPRSLPYEPFPKCEWTLALPPPVDVRVVSGLCSSTSAVRKPGSAFLPRHSSSSAIPSTHTTLTDSDRRAVCIGHLPHDSKSVVAQRLDVLLSAPKDAASSLLAGTFLNPSETSRTSRPSPRLPSALRSDDLSQETSPNIPFMSYLAPRSPEETLRWSLSSATDLLVSSSSAHTVFLSHVECLSPPEPRDGPFATKKSAPELQSSTMITPSKEPKKRLESLFSRLGPPPSVPPPPIPALTASVLPSSKAVLRPLKSPARGKKLRTVLASLVILIPPPLVALVASIS